MSDVAPEPTRAVPDGWVEIPQFAPAEIESGLWPGWQYLTAPGIGESVAYFPPDGSPPQAWAVRRGRILGEPIAIHETTDTPPTQA